MKVREFKRCFLAPLSTFVGQQRPVGCVRSRRRAAQAAQTSLRRSIGEVNLQVSPQGHRVFAGLRKPRAQPAPSSRRGAGAIGRGDGGCRAAIRRLARRGPQRRPGLQALLRQDPPDHRRFEDDRDDLELPTAVRAMLNIDLNKSPANALFAFGRPQSARPKSAASTVPAAAECRPRRRCLARLPWYRNSRLKSEAMEGKHVFLGLHTARHLGSCS